MACSRRCSAELWQAHLATTLSSPALRGHPRQPAVQAGRQTPSQSFFCAALYGGRGFRYRKNRTGLPGAPDIVFPGARLIVFVDGDFWHGKNWKTRKAKLAQGHNANYWIRKIERNVARDREQSRELRASGWLVLRV
jgi:DNA mismatch endonuclease, patch repair protein